MTNMSLKDIHERLMLYKLAKAVVEVKKQETNRQNHVPWLCNLSETESSNTDLH